MTKLSTSFAIRENQTNDAGTDVWSSRWFARILGCGDYLNFEGVVEKARLACFNSGHRIEDHFVDVTEMIEIGSGGLIDGANRLF